MELNNNKYYVGKTKCITKRYDEHFSGEGAVWTKLYKPIRFIEFKTCEKMLDELETTLTYMKDYGIDNVRGACFSNVILSYGDKYVIKKMIADMYDICYICHQEGHFASNCKLNKYTTIEPIPKKQYQSESDNESTKVISFEEYIHANLMKELDKN